MLRAIFPDTPPYFQLPRLALSITLIASAINTAYAQSTELEERIIVTGVYSPVSVLAATTNIDILSSQEINRVAPSLPADILNRLTGVHIQTNNGMDSLPSLRSPVLTGPGAGGAFIVAQDGIPTRAAGFANNNSLSELNLSSATRVEVVRGPASAIYGSNAVHGVFNMLSAELTAANAIRVLLDKQQRQFETQFSNDDLGLAYQYINDKGFRADSGFVSNKIDTKLSSQIGEATVTSTFSGFNVDQDTAGFISSADNGQCFTTSYADATLYRDRAVMNLNCDPDAFRQWSSVRLNSRWQWQLNDTEQLTITPYYRNNNMTFRQHYLPSRAIENNSHSSVGINSRYAQSISERLDIVTGINLEHTIGTLKQTQDIPSRFSFGKARQQGLHYNYQVNAQNIAPFIQVTYLLNNTISIDTSIRWDNTKYDYTNTIADGTTQADGTSCQKTDGSAVACLFLRPGDRTDRFSNESLKIGATWLINPNSSLYSAISTGFRAPQTTDLYRLQNQQDIGQIKSERVDSYEIGYRYQTKELNLELVGYDMRKTNFFFRDASGLNVTDGKTVHQGIEVSADYSLSSVFSITGSVTLSAHQYDFNRLNSGVVKGNEIDTAPSQLSNVQLLWTPTNALNVEIEWLHIGNYYLDPANEHTYKGHELIHARTHFALTPDVTLTANIENITDTKYASRADYAFGSYRFFGGQPRTIKLGLSMAF